MLSRSLLFVPAHKEKILLKINQLQADIVIIDLEDAVAASDKQESRNLITKHIHALEKSIFIRINSIETDEFMHDMQFIKNISGADALQGVMLPKSSCETDINALASYLEETEQSHKRKSKILIIPLIENAQGVNNVDDVINADERVSMVALGGEDFLNDIDAQKTLSGSELFYARSKIVVSSRAHNIEKPIDTVYTDFKDTDGFRKSCAYVKSLGFGGKLLIHPNQIEAVNTTFSPSSEEIEVAREIVSHAEKNNGAFSLNGKMIDKPIIEKANKTLSEYKSIQSK